MKFTFLIRCPILIIIYSANFHTAFPINPELTHQKLTFSPFIPVFRPIKRIIIVTFAFITLTQFHTQAAAISFFKYFD
jgi:hypothetical protein